MYGSLSLTFGFSEEILILPNTAINLVKIPTLRRQHDAHYTVSMY